MERHGTGYRGRGIGSRLLRETARSWFDSLGAKYGLPLCADALIPFYARLGWCVVDARVVFAQPDGSRAWGANCMLLAPEGLAAMPREIDLSGLPW